VNPNSGASATDDKRPVFQQMIERACDGENAFDVIAVHQLNGGLARLTAR
jgi:site-specific DNA recombinase